MPFYKNPRIWTSAAVLLCGCPNQDQGAETFDTASSEAGDASTMSAASEPTTSGAASPSGTGTGDTSTSATSTSGTSTDDTSTSATSTGGTTEGTDTTDDTSTGDTSTGDTSTGDPIQDTDTMGASTGPEAPCGNGMLDPGEVCDDGDTLDDACSEDCQTVQKTLSIATGNGHTCALFEGGAVKCWGGNSQGTLGLGDTQYRGNNPGEMGANLPFVDLGGPALRVRAGGISTCALLAGGIIKCWGYNYTAGDGSRKELAAVEAWLAAHP